MANVSAISAGKVAEVRERVALGCQVLAANGHNDFVWGHVSVRDPEGRGVWMKAAALGMEEISAKDVILVGFDGEVLAGDGARHAEWPIHTEVMLTHPEVNAVVHSHPSHAIALGASGQPLRPVSGAAVLFTPPDVPRFTETSAMITTKPQGSRLAGMLGDQGAVLMVNHGIMTVGAEVHQAVVRAVLLEKAAHEQMLTYAFGGPQHWTDDDEAPRKRAAFWEGPYTTTMWNYLTRRLSAPSQNGKS
jgi:ribulose-5-phosphate 4-epimerase/fuculose-1-phosphate aldolase